MANNDTLLITGGVSTTAQADYEPADLAPNNYLTIIWKDKQGVQYNSLDIDDKKALQYTNDLNNAIEQGINSGKVSYIGSTKYVNVESIAKYLAQNMLDTSPQRTVVNALIGLATGSAAKLGDGTINLIVNVFGEVAEKTARSFGFSDPHEIFASFASENTIKFLSELGGQAKNYMQNCVNKFRNRGKSESSITSKESDSGDNDTGKRYVGLILGLTTSDTESYEITIPRKKVEDGSDYTTHLLPQPFKKDFNVILTNKVLSSDYNRAVEIENIEKVKDKLIEIAQSRILFDIYVRLSADKCYKRSDVYFSSISFTKDENSGNNYTCSFSVEPITSFKTKLFVSNRKYFPTASKTSSSGSGGSYTYGSGSGKSKGTGSSAGSLGGGRTSSVSTKGNKLYVGFEGVENVNLSNQYMTAEQMYRFARNNGYMIYYSQSSSPNYLFIRPGKVTLTKDGFYALTKDTTGIVWRTGNSVSKGGQLEKGYTFTKRDGVTNGKGSYYIYAPSGSTVTSSNRGTSGTF